MQQTIHAVAIEGTTQAVYWFEDEAQARDVYTFAANYNGWKEETVTRFTFQAPLTATPAALDALARLKLACRDLRPIESRRICHFKPTT